MYRWMLGTASNNVPLKQLYQRLHKNAENVEVKIKYKR